jgi:hypothetical protein
MFGQRPLTALDPGEHRCNRRAIEDDDVALAANALGKRVAGVDAELHVVGLDCGLHARHGRVRGNHHNAGHFCAFDARTIRLRVSRRDDMMMMSTPRVSASIPRLPRSHLIQ